MNHLSVAQASYIAGCIDCDGSITLKKRWNRDGSGYAPMVVIGQAKPQLVERMKEMIGEGVITPCRHREYMFYEYRLCSNGCRQLLPQIKEYLVLKKEQAETVLEYLKTVTKGGKRIEPSVIDIRNKLHAKMAKLNLKPSQMANC